MGKAWDYDVPSVALWRECLRVLKPGAPLVAFGGSRTYHRLACGIEDAGFELRDCLMWLYGKGFPKSQNIGLAIDKSSGATRPILGKHPNPAGNKAGGSSLNMSAVGMPKEAFLTAPATELAKRWNGWGTALKPAHEPIVLARKPLEGTMVANVTKYGVGGLAIDACRGSAEGNVKWSEPRGGIWTIDPEAKGERVGGGRWPANLLLDEDAAVLLDASVAPTTSVPFRENEAEGNVLPFTKRTAGGYSDSGGPSRFFYCSKVSTKEREAGCGDLDLRTAGQVTGDPEEDSPGLARNHHPTLKPLSLTTWLARLICPPNPGVILVPFAGAGSEMIGCLKAGWGGVFGIEREEEYTTIARARLRHWCPESEAA